VLHIAGGTYLERCLFPEWNELFGSGVRAACAVKSLQCNVELHTYVGAGDAATLKARAVGSGFRAISHETPQTICFEYFHGLSTPVITPPPHVVDVAPPFKLSGANILRFGLIEGDAIVHGENVVYDPQSPQKPVLFQTNGSTAKRLAIVSNRTEGHLLTGERDPHRIAAALAQSQSCEVVVIKCGSYGCVVADRGQTSDVPAFLTDNVWPIGSGDVFAAVFAKVWANDGKPAAEAAEVASKATAYFCNTMILDFPSGFPAGFDFPPIYPKKEASIRAYLAGPFFSMSQNWLIEQALDALRSQGFEVFSPLHHVGRGAADQVYAKDIKGLEQCDLVFACVDGLDSGTIFEIGYARALNKPVVAFVQNEMPEDLKMLDGSGCVLERDFVTAIYKAYWLAAT
jgi:nucleoside 2-deoxyribosyltransferase